MTVTLDTYIVATAVENEEGKFHPAIKHGLRVYYWPRDVYASKMGAHECAEDMLAQVTKDLNDSLGFGQQALRELSSNDWV